MTQRESDATLLISQPQSESMSLKLRSRQMLFWVLCTAVVFVQSLGLVHRVSHGPSAHDLVSAQAAETRTGNPALPGMPGSDVLSVMFGGHQDLSKCQSLEHLGTSAPPACLQVFLPPAPPAQGFLVISDQRVPATLVAAYRSRAPPYSV